MLVVGQEVPAGGAPFAGGDQVLVAAVGVHDEHLVAIVGRPGGLKDEALAIGRPIGLGVLAAVRELADVSQSRRLGGQGTGGESGKEELPHRG